MESKGMGGFLHKKRFLKLPVRGTGKPELTKDDPMIKKFNRIEDSCIEKIYGQDRFGYSQSDFEDLYDLIKWAEQGGSHDFI